MTAPPDAQIPGLPARKIAADILDTVLRKRRPLDEQFDGAAAHHAFAALPERDRALVRHIVATALRRLGTLRHLIGDCLDRGLPKDMPLVENALLVGATQILFLDVPDHAAVDLSVRLVQADRTGALCRPGQCRAAAASRAKARARSPSSTRSRSTRRPG